ncbi:MULTISPECIES: hypothetical protein [Cryobacterium]|uniref:Uncharacterized protein n=1 Tax=Cryobacterium breve TaxID=1259258 RepID=A0ABY2J4K4_9MICO|nr:MULTISPECIES: hypothetical protein [Cryobacterium]TFC92076.1 hypothetical protein E3T20_12235 [Cryobacterium sp. TmT3-12]TFC99785.1 hypothetical protein E3O65_05270 [Cryobacterium breve]
MSRRRSTWIAEDPNPELSQLDYWDMPNTDYTPSAPIPETDFRAAAIIMAASLSACVIVITVALVASILGVWRA